MTEYIVDVTNEEAEQLVARFGIDGVTMFGYRLAGEIVRCRDCEHSYEVTWPAGSNIPHDYLDCIGGELVETWDYYNDEPKMNPVKPDGFCAWGSRRDA